MVVEVGRKADETDDEVRSGIICELATRNENK
jgi:hypothetical protein